MSIINMLNSNQKNKYIKFKAPKNKYVKFKAPKNIYKSKNKIYSRIFKKKTGISPGHYRRQSKNNAPKIEEIY